MSDYKCCENCHHCDGRVRGSMEYAKCNRFMTYCSIAVPFHCGRDLKYWILRKESMEGVDQVMSVYDCIPEKEEHPEESGWNKFKKWLFKPIKCN